MIRDYEKWLDENSKLAASSEAVVYKAELAQELIRLERLGLWAEKYGVPAVRKAVLWQQDLAEHQEPLLRRGLERAIDKWDEATDFAVMDFKPLMDALEALPKEE